MSLETLTSTNNCCLIETLVDDARDSSSDCGGDFHPRTSLQHLSARRGH